jgi:predicted lipoprotein with Yx(FWY)xxD motif
MSRKPAATAGSEWTVEEEKKLVSAVETFGATSWANVAANVPGRNETQCSKKWRTMSQKVAATASGTWTVEEEKKLASAVETFGATSWANIAANVPGRNESQCSNKWQRMSKKVAATASGTWTVEEEMKLAYAVETYYGGNWAEIAKMFPGRNESQCHQQWLRVSEETAGAEPPKKRRRIDWV